MLFLGAGASAPFGIPTAPALTKEISGLVDRNVLDAINRFLTPFGREPNYEQILTLLVALTNSADVPKNHYARPFLASYPNYRKDYSHVIDNMYEIICEHCNNPFISSSNQYLKPEELEKKFQLTYDSLIGVYLSHGQQDLVFSTNYDPSLEIWCQKRNLACSDGSEPLHNTEVRKMDETSHIAKLRYVLGLSQFSPLERRPPLTNTVGLARLHGSVWTYEVNDDRRIKFTTPKDRRLFSDLYEDVTNRKPILVFPGEEEKLTGGRWDALYQFFKENLVGFCLFIGYSFRHDVIDRPILDNLKNGKITQLGVLAPDPDELIRNLSGGKALPEKRIVRMPAKFGEESAIRELVQKWFPVAYNIKFSTENDLLDHVTKWKIKMTEYVR